MEYENPPSHIKIADRTVFLKKEENKQMFYSALQDFLGHGYGNKVTELSRKHPDHTVKLRELPFQELDARVLRWIADEERWNDEYFDFLFHKLPHDDQEALIHSQNDPHRSAIQILMLRRNTPTQPFTNALVEHAKAHHHGNLPLTELKLEGQARLQQASTSPVLNQDVGRSVNAIKFYAIAQNPKIQNLINRLNADSDPYELYYQALVTIRALTNARNKLAGSGVPAGIALEQILEHVITPQLGEGASQQISQVAGEVMTMFVNVADKIMAKIQQNKQNHESKQETQVNEREPFSNFTPLHEIQYFDVDFSPFPKKQQVINTLARSIVLAGTVASTVFLSNISQETHSLAPYALIPALNTSMITLYELLERTMDESGIHITPEEKKALIDKAPTVIKPFLQRLPDNATIAFSDFYSNKYAVGTFIGSLLGSALVMPLEKTGVKHEIIYALSGMITENAVALLFGATQTALKDPYSEFKAALPKLTQRT